MIVCRKCENNRCTDKCTVHDIATAQVSPKIYIDEQLTLNIGEQTTLKVSESAARKAKPLFSGVLMYFPDALMAVAEHSRKANDKHNPGQPLHWSKGKSADHADCIARHLLDIGTNWDEKDPEFGSYHATALAWRALALLQTVLEREKQK